MRRGFAQNLMRFLENIEAGSPKKRTGMLTRNLADRFRVVFYEMMTRCTGRVCEDPIVSPRHAFFFYLS